MANLQTRLNALVDAVAANLNKKLNYIASTSALSAYSGTATQIILADGRVFNYSASSSATADAFITLAATGKGSGRWIGATNGYIDFVKWFPVVDTTGNTDCAGYLQTAINYGGTIYLTGTLFVNANINLVSNCEILGSRGLSLLLGTGITTQLFFAETLQNVAIIKVTASRKAGNTSSPILLCTKATKGIKFNENVLTGVLGLNTYRPVYSTVTVNDLCYDIIVKDNIIKNVGAGAYKGAITLQYCVNARVSRNSVDGCQYAIYWWGGDGNPSSSENNNANTNPKWAQNITIDNNSVKNCNLAASDGAGIWGSMGSNIKIANNTIESCTDVGIDFEACLDCVAIGNSVTNCTNAAMAIFYGSKNIVFANNIVNQAQGFGFGFWALGTLMSNNIKLLGGSITITSTDKEAIFTDDGVLTDFTVGGGISLDAQYRTVKLQKVVNARFSDCVIKSLVLNVDAGARLYAVYIQGGDGAFFDGVNFVYTGNGIGAVGTVLLSDGGSGNQTNATIQNTKCIGFQYGIKQDQFLGGTGNKFARNQLPSIDVTNGIYYGFENRNAANVLIGNGFDNSKVFSGNTAISGTKEIRTGNLATMDLQSGFYSVFPAVTGLPTADNFTLTCVHHEDINGGPGGGTWQTWSIIKFVGIVKMYVGGRNGDGTQKAWTTII